MRKDAGKQGARVLPDGPLLAVGKGFLRSSNQIIVPPFEFVEAAARDKDRRLRRRDMEAGFRRTTRFSNDFFDGVPPAPATGAGVTFDMGKLITHYTEYGPSLAPSELSSVSSRSRKTSISSANASILLWTFLVSS